MLHFTTKYYLATIENHILAFVTPLFQQQSVSTLFFLLHGSKVKVDKNVFEFWVFQTSSFRIIVSFCFSQLKETRNRREEPALNLPSRLMSLGTALLVCNVLRIFSTVSLSLFICSSRDPRGSGRPLVMMLLFLCVLAWISLKTVEVMLHFIWVISSWRLLISSDCFFAQYLFCWLLIQNREFCLPLMKVWTEPSAGRFSLVPVYQFGNCPECVEYHFLSFSWNCSVSVMN